MVADKNYTNETAIKIRFNNLCQQFENNSKYINILGDQTINDGEDISYGMLVKNKRYEAVFHQNSGNSIDYKMRPVWFMISELYGEYGIYMFYDNEYNRANGEDL